MSKAINNPDPLSGIILQGAAELAVGEVAPRSDWSRMGELDHFVQFYETDTFLLDSITGFIGTGLEKGEAAIVVATGPHREALELRLSARGLDVASLKEAEQYVSLDASETLATFTLEGSPDPSLFKEAIGSLVSRIAEGRPSVRIFGEMVALLWAEGKQQEAATLEGFWNELRKTHRFSLLCGYPINGFCDESMTESLHGICTQHSGVVPTESYTSLNDADERLRAIILLQQKARMLEAELEERKLLLARERLARTEAESANRLKDEFLATVSHELRTPLTAILGWSHMLLHTRLSEEAKTRAIKTIERNAKVQAQLVEDILDVSRVITGNLRLNVEQVDAAAIINAAIDSVQLAADSKDIRLEVTFDPSARHIQGDASRLQQVVWNLLSNAIKFTTSGGQVRVRLERAASCVQIKVSDTGQGISQDFLPFIFDRFRQADGSSTRRHGGLGLGLAIVRHLAELHGGTAWAESQGEGLGATFIVRLPLAVDREGARTSGRVKSLRLNDESDTVYRSLPTLDGVRVLLVDDDRDTLKLLGMILSEYRATVQTASSAAEALELFEWYRPDVLVTDLAMPYEDGYSLIRKVRELESDTDKKSRAIALTAYARVEDRARALSEGFNLFVPKPVEPGELVISIANITGPNN